MNRLLMILVAFALLVAACSGAAADKGPDSDNATDAKEVLDAPPAKDFTLALEPSGEFVLSREAKPVYMVFWAEW